MAGIIYLRPPFTLGGNDLALLVILALAGIALGALSGMGDTVWRGGAGMLLFRAGVVSVLAWLVGMGFSLGFAYYAYHSGGPTIARFSVRHDITGANIWTTALFLMAAGQVLARLGVLQLRPVLVAGPPATSGQPTGQAAGRLLEFATRRSLRHGSHEARRQSRPGRADRHADASFSQSEGR